MIHQYKIYKDGSIYAEHMNRFMKPYNNGLGYKAVKLYVDGKRKQFYVHRLVAKEYLGDITNMVVNHIDGNKSNNCIENLEICTQQENQRHAFKNGLLSGFVAKYY